VYLYARRPNAARFTTYEKVWHVGRYADFIRRELQQTLRNSPPAVFALTLSDYERLRDPRPEQRPLDWFERWLGPWLEQHYRVVERIAGPWPFVVLRRSDPPATTRSTPRSSPP